MIRLGTTSCIWHDYMLPNVRQLAPLVDDIELLLFSVDEDVPTRAEVAELAALQHDHGLSYTVHTPLDASLASADERRRVEGVDKVRRAIDWGRPLAPLAFTVHVYLGDREHDDAPPRDLDAWRDRARRSLETLRAELPSRALSVECIDYDFALIAPVVEALDLSVSLDVGHLMRDGADLRAMVTRWLDRARILQLHGTRVDERGVRDHKSLAFAPRAELEWLLGTLRARHFGGVLTLEVFSAADLSESLGVISSLANSFGDTIALKSKSLPTSTAQ